MYACSHFCKYATNILPKHIRVEVSSLSLPERTEDVDSVEDLEKTYLTATMVAGSQPLTSASTTAPAAAAVEVTPNRKTEDSSESGENGRTERRAAGKIFCKPPTAKSR